MITTLITTPHHCRLIWLIRLLCLTLLCAGAQADSSAEFVIIPLQHRPAEVMEAQLQPHLSASTSVSSSGNNLVLRGDASEIAQLRMLVQSLDQPLAQFVIHVRHQQGGSSNAGGLTVNGQVVGGNNTQIRHSDGTQITTRVITRSTRSEGNNTYQVRATEGYAAYINTGEQIPVRTTRHGYYGSESSTTYQPVISGVYVTPLVSGSGRVQLNLNTEKSTVQSVYGRSAPTIASTGYSGVVEASLNEWVNIGGISLSSSGAERHLSTRSLSNQALEIMVQQVQ